MAVLCSVSFWWLAAAVAQADTAPTNDGGPPTITGTARQGDVLIASPGGWSGDAPMAFSYLWSDGQTGSAITLSAADVGQSVTVTVTASNNSGQSSATSAGVGPVLPEGSTTGTSLLATPSAPVTNQNVTLIATVTAGTSTALWGTVTFENGGAAINGCGNMPAVPSGQSATVACSTSFAATTAQLTAVFTPASGSILQGSSSRGTSLAIAPDASSTTLAAASSVNVGASTTYTAAVAPASSSGPVRPTGSIEFLDGSTPIDSCVSQPLSGGAASCTVSYATPGRHQITARYSGDANFKGSSSPASQVSALTAPATVLGTITATMQWAFYFTPKYTVVRNLVVNGLAPGGKVLVQCQGHGCPFTTRATVLTKRKRCGHKAKRACLTPGTLNLTPSFTGRHLRVGARITVSIVRPSWVGKSYRFTVQARRGPRVQIGSLPAA
jgi:Bacterial Ig-like domain (group 3)